MRPPAPGYNSLRMTRRAATALALPVLAIALPGCVTLPEGPVGFPVVPANPPAGAVVVPPPPNPPQAEPSAPAAPPRPSLSLLTNRNRSHIEFFGAKIFADSISGAEASGNVFVDGREVHQVNRSFPIAVYAGRIDVDAKKERVTLSDWPIVQTDSAYVQGLAKDTVIILSPDRMARIKGPARYVIGTKDGELFAP